MKLLILSDLHLEFSSLDIDTKDADVVILAGDIQVGTRAFPWIQSQLKHLPVIYIPGNHEYYKGDVSRVLHDLRQAATDSGHVHVLNNESVTLQGVTFLGSTLWTDFALFGSDLLTRTKAMITATYGMTDYRVIRFDHQNCFRRLHPQDTAAFHVQSRQWLTQQLAMPTKYKRVVITHHAPSAMSVPSHYTDDPLTPNYASRLEPLVAQADMWIHGHLHSSSDYLVGSCRVVSNPRGYVLKKKSAENSGFNPALIIEI